MGGRRRHTKKHKRSRRTRGGFTAPNYQGALGPGINAPMWNGPSVSTTTPVVVGYGAAPSTMSGYGRKTRHRRSRKTRRHHRRSMRGGSDGSRVFTSFTGEPVGGVAVGAVVRSGVATGVQPS